MKTMMMSWLLALLPFAAGAADVTLMPVNVHLDRNTDRTTVQVTNNGSEAVVMQAEAIAWTRVAGVDADAPTSDIIVNPPVFTVKPGQTQVVRVGLRRSAELQQEATYRMVLREVPTLRTADIGSVSGSVRVLVSLRVPIYVAPAKVQRNENWRVQRDANGDVVAHVSNTGNVHIKVAELKLKGEGSEGLALEQKGPQSVLFPGEERSFRVQRIATGEPTSLQVRTDQGLQQLALNR